MGKSRTGLVYLLHFSQPVAHAQHYFGFINDPSTLEARVERHRTGRGGRLPGVAASRGFDLIVARTWTPGTVAMERRFKASARGRKLCLICSPRPGG